METITQLELFPVAKVEPYQAPKVERHYVSKCELYQVAEVELHYKSKVKPSSRPQIKSSTDAYQIFKNSWDMERIELLEQFKILLINHANRVLGIYEVSTGGITGTVADPRLIFAAALTATATSIFLAHSHPSGTLAPSQADQKLTKQLKLGGEILGIPVLDHLILTSESYFSFADAGLL